MNKISNNSVLRTFFWLAVPLALLAQGCDSSDSSFGVMTPPAPTRTLAAGETIPLGTSVTINKSAVYPLAPGANRLTTRCTGRVDVIIESTPGNPVTNTCDSLTGSSQQTNLVGGLRTVEYVLGQGASGRVTLE